MSVGLYESLRSAMLDEPDLKAEGKGQRSAGRSQGTRASEAPGTDVGGLV
jgi:hypothetical protein